MRPEKSRVGGVDEWVKEMCAWRQLYSEGIFGVERDEAALRIDQIERCLRKMSDFDGIDMGDADLSFLNYPPAAVVSLLEKDPNS